MSEQLTPEQAQGLRSRGDRWLSSYWFTFDPTGVEAVDLVLAAVARAGKMFHSTEFWDDPEMSLGDGPTPLEIIQRAANSAAALLADDGAAAVARERAAIEADEARS